MKEAFLSFYNTLDLPEKRNLWFGFMAFTVGLAMLLYTLFPPSWNNWVETKGNLISAQSLSTGAFSGGTTLYTIEFLAQNDELKIGTFSMSPIVLSTLKTIRVFYKKDNSNVFYVHNPTQTVIALALTLLGGGLLVTYFLYYKDRLQGITYD